MSTKVRHTGAAVQAQVQTYAATLGLHLERRNTGVGRYENKDGTERFVRYGEPGTGDLSGVLPGGRYIEVECKATGELPTMAQFDRIVRLNQAGAIAVWFDAIDTAIAVLPEVMRGKRVRYLSMAKAELYDPEGRC